MSDFIQTELVTQLSNLRRTRWSFFVLCVYLFSQSFMIPIMVIGSLWAIWPTLADFSVGLFLLKFIHSFRASVISRENKRIFFILLIMFCSCFLSYFVFTIGVPNTFSTDGAKYGAFQMYRLAEFIFIFWMVSSIPLTQKRLAILKHLVSIVLVFVCFGVILTYFSIVQPSVFIRHLPYISGPWIDYAYFNGIGVGTISYNHGYVALQVLTLLSLRIHLSSPNQKVLINSILICLALLAVFLSGSRAGMLAILFFTLGILANRPRYLVIIIIIFLVFCLSFDGVSELKTAVERQSSIITSYEVDGFAGRNIIWQDRLAFLNEQPFRWLVGTGFGSAVNSGQNGHLLYLHIILETGLVGLLAFVLLKLKLLNYLHQKEKNVKSMFWVTIAFLVSALTQETFYPVPAFGHFIGLYLCALSITLRPTGVE